MVTGELLSAYQLHTLDLALVLLVYKLRPLQTAVTLAIMTLMLKADAKVFADLMHLITC